MKEKRIWNGLYGIRFVLVCSNSRDDVFNKYNVEWNETGGCFEDGGVIYVLINPNVPVYILVHECEHAVSELWRLRGIEKINGIDECFAYMLSWLFRKCDKFVKKTQKDPTKRH